MMPIRFQLWFFYSRNPRPSASICPASHTWLNKGKENGHTKNSGDESNVNKNTINKQMESYITNSPITPIQRISEPLCSQRVNGDGHHKWKYCH